MAIAHKSSKLNHCALKHSRVVSKQRPCSKHYSLPAIPTKCAPPNSSSLLLHIIKSLELSERRYQASEAHYQISPTRTLARPFHTKLHRNYASILPLHPGHTSHKHHPPLHPSHHQHYYYLRDRSPSHRHHRTKQRRILSLNSRHYQYNCRRAGLVPWIGVVCVSCTGCDAGAEEGSVEGE
jgi:hypothetical protein